MEIRVGFPRSAFVVLTGNFSGFQGAIDPTLEANDPQNQYGDENDVEDEQRDGDEETENGAFPTRIEKFVFVGDRRTFQFAFETRADLFGLFHVQRFPLISQRRLTTTPENEKSTCPKNIQQSIGQEEFIIEFLKRRFALRTILHLRIKISFTVMIQSNRSPALLEQAWTFDQ